MEASSDFLAESHPCVYCCLSIWPNPQYKCNPLLRFFPLRLAIIPPTRPPSFPVSEYNLPPPFQWQGHRFGLLWIAVGWSFVTLAAAVLSLGMVHMARGQESGSVRTLCLATAQMSCCLFHLGKQTLYIALTSHLTSIHCTGWLFTWLISWGFDIWLIVKLCGCVYASTHVRLIDWEVRGQQSICLR